MNRIRHSYDEEKNRKIESLSSGSQNRNENVEPNKAKQSVKKRRKMRRQKERRRRFKKIQKKRKNQKIEQEWTELLEESVKVQEEFEEKRPLDVTNIEWSPAQLKLLAKGQKFVPTPTKIDWVAKFKHYLAFARKCRLAVYFSRRGYNVGHQEEVDNIENENESKNKPWQSASSFSPEPCENTALEKF